MDKTTIRKSLRPGRAIVLGDVQVHVESVNGQNVVLTVVSPYHVKVVLSDLDKPERESHNPR